MRNKKYLLNHLPTAFRLVLVSISLLCLLPSLMAQQEASEQEAPPTKKATSGKTKIITGIGFDIAIPFVTTDGSEQVQSLKDRGLDDSEFYLNLGGHIPFLMTVKTFDLGNDLGYGIGFGAYFSFRYQIGILTGDLDVNAITRNNLNSPGANALPVERRDAYTVFERGEISFAPVFYNELVLNEQLALSFSVGPTFTLTLGDTYLTEVQGTNTFPASAIVPGTQGNTDTVIATEYATSFTRRESLQFSFGILLDLSFQIRFNQKIGMSFGAVSRIYFVGQKAAISPYAWTTDQVFFGDVGANISFLLFY